jgi:plasmid stabilization system protein ParE
MRLVYSEDAVADLARLRVFIAEKDPAAAARVAADLVARVEHLGRFPNLGRSVVDAPEADIVRDAVFGNNVVRYSVHGDAVVVLRVWHHYEDR